jgi:NADH dehydrogenase [ubiquinone] 1 alpha subcomplex assembly factor 7
MTPLAEGLAQRIARTGPISIAEFMAECLTHPRHGYYTRRDPFGAAGDFVTAPEISQMFGELIGLCLAEAWTAQGRPAPFTLAELGPGRGTLMADALRATRTVPGFHDAMRLVLVEVSPALRKLQAERLAAHRPEWCDGVAGLDRTRGPLFAVANEFFDALPIRQFVRAGSGWAERMVGLDGAGALAFGLAPPAPLADLARRSDDTRDGDLVELCPAGAATAAALGRNIAERGGVCLVVDYGDWRSLGDTLQAVRNHEPAGPLETPGEVDLTAHVDFEALALAAAGAGCAHSRLTPQGVFLERLGITHRARTLARGLDGDALDRHVAAHRRLTHPDEMGNLFKAMALYPTSAAPPPGLDP